jgi:hypothetical protein
MKKYRISFINEVYFEAIIEAETLEQAEENAVYLDGSHFVEIQSDYKDNSRLVEEVEQ